MSSKTVKVRIAVAVDKSGHWHGYGSDSSTDKDAIEEVVWNIDDDQKAVYFVTVELPIPEPTEVTGSVEAAEKGRDAT